MDIKRQLIITGRELAGSGLVSDVSGNISVKDENGIIITASGANLSHLTGHDLVRVDQKGQARGIIKPSVEVNLHLEIYKSREDVSAIIHTHSVFVTVLSCLKQELMEVNPEAGQFSKVKISRYKTYGTKELAKEAVKKLGKQPAVIMEKHGAAVVGKNLKDALTRAFVLEEVAKITYFINLTKK